MELIDDLIDFLAKSPTKYHFATCARNLLKKRKLVEVEMSQLENNNIPDKGFLVINRTTIVAYQLGTVDKSLIFSSSIKGKALNIVDENNKNENGTIQCSINYKESNPDSGSELLSSFDYLIAGEVFLKEKSRIRPFLFKSDQPIGMIEKDSAFLSLSDDSIDTYLEYTFSIPIQGSEIIEKNIFLIPDIQAFNKEEMIFTGSSRSIINLSNLSTFGVSYLTLKAFLSSLGKSTFNKFIIISPDESEINSSSLTQYINLILATKGTSINSETLNFNIGGIESCWSSHCSETSSKFLSKGIVMQNFLKNDVVLDKLAKFGIPIFFDHNQEIEYSLNPNQIILNDGKLPTKISLPLFNYKQVSETVSISDIFNLFNSLYELCMI